ncbi:MAG: STAS domain-containing protein [Halieaceae bacterium]|jgi:anti-anti-sigma factor|nr:STAS domain-containing protein [Halieaceae bacterium]
MTDCRVSAARDHGAYVLRLEGDVRLTMCTALDDYFSKIFADPDFVSVWVDVTEAEGLDSTTLGMLAQLAMQTKARFGFKPALFTAKPGINRLVRSMGFQQLFDVREEHCCDDSCAAEIPSIDASEGEVKDKVIAAHKALMSINERNRAEFTDLIRALETGADAQG